MLAKREALARQKPFPDPEGPKRIGLNRLHAIHRPAFAAALRVGLAALNASLPSDTSTRRFATLDADAQDAALRPAPAGRRKTERQGSLFLTADELPKSGGHPFYQKLNRLLAAAKFDDWIEARCRAYYDPRPIGRPSIPPGVYFRMLLVHLLSPS